MARTFTRRDFLKISALSAANAILERCGTDPNSQTSTPQGPSSQNFRVETICPPKSPESHLKEIEKLNPNEATSQSCPIQTDNGSNITFELRGTQDIKLNSTGLTQVVRLAENMDPTTDLTYTPEGFKAELLTDFTKPFMDNSVLVTHNGTPTSCLSGTKGVFGFTVNPFKEEGNSPSVSEISLQLIRNAYKSSGPSYTAWALATEVAQQTRYRPQNLNTDFDITFESFANSFGLAIAIRQLELTGTVFENNQTAYQYYRSKAEAIIMRTPSGLNVKYVVFSPEAWDQKIATIMTSPVVEPTQ